MGSVRVVLGVVLLLQEARPFVLLLLAVLLLLSRRVRVDVQERQRGDADGRSVVVAEREMVVLSGSIRMVAVVEGATGESVCFATFFRAVQAGLLWYRTKGKHGPETARGLDFNTQGHYCVIPWGEEQKKRDHFPVCRHTHLT